MAPAFHATCATNKTPFSKAMDTLISEKNTITPPVNIICDFQQMKLNVSMELRYLTEKRYLSALEWKGYNITHTWPIESQLKAKVLLNMLYLFKCGPTINMRRFQ
jgi:hypothetical protein